MATPYPVCLLRSLAIYHDGTAAEVGHVGESVWTRWSSRMLCMYVLIDEAALMAI